MLTFAIIISVLILIALLRFGVIVEYDEAGVKLWVKAVFLKFRILDEDKKDKPKKKKKKKKKKEKKPKEKRPGGFRRFMDLLKAAIKALGRLKRRLLIKQLTLHFTSASDDPSKTAIQYGSINAVFGAVVPVIERQFRIKRRDLRASVDFTASEPVIYAKVIISIAVWEVFYIAFAFLPVLISMATAKSGSGQDKNVKNTISDNNIKKDGQENGKETGKRLDGNLDAEYKGDDRR